MFFLLPLSFANEPPPPIVGGSVTNSFLQVGAIAALDPNGYGAAFCSGTLIDDTWILTAAHCIIGNDAAEGMANQGYDIYFVTATNIWSAGYGDWHPVKNMVAHPYYSGEQYEIANDIGLLELQNPLTNITPAILNSDEPSTYWGDITYVGYGLTGDNEEDSMGIGERYKYQCGHIHILHKKINFSIHMIQMVKRIYAPAIQEELLFVRHHLAIYSQV